MFGVLRLDRPARCERPRRPRRGRAPRAAARWAGVRPPPPAPGAAACLIHQVHGRGQRGGQGLEAGLAHRQAFGVAHELEARVHRVLQHIGDVVEVERGQVARPVLHPERAEGPAQCVAIAFVRGVGIGVQRREKRGPSGNRLRAAMRWARVESRPCRKASVGVDGLGVGLVVSQESPAPGDWVGWQRHGHLAHGLRTRGARAVRGSGPAPGRPAWPARRGNAENPSDRRWTDRACSAASSAG